MCDKSVTWTSPQGLSVLLTRQLVSPRAAALPESEEEPAVPFMALSRKLHTMFPPYSVRSKSLTGLHSRGGALSSIFQREYQRISGHSLNYISYT